VVAAGNPAELYQSIPADLEKRIRFVFAEN
jgi:hypothetical protein